MTGSGDGCGSWIITCTEILIVEFCTSPESEMKEVGNRTEGVEVLTVTEADDGTRSDTVESVREQMVSHRKRGKLGLVVVNSVHRRMSVSVYLHQEIWSGLYGSSSRIVPDSEEAMERFLTDVGSSRFCSD